MAKKELGFTDYLNLSIFTCIEPDNFNLKPKKLILPIDLFLWSWMISKKLK